MPPPPQPPTSPADAGAGAVLPEVRPDQVAARAVAFVLLAILLSWLPLGLLLVTDGDPAAGAGAMVLWLLGGLGPGLAAVLLSWHHEGRAGLRRILSSLTRWRLGRHGWLLLVPLVVGLLGVAVAVWVGEASWEIAGPSYLLLVPVLLVGGVVFGGLEEIGWRGHLQPLLQVRLSGLAAALVVGVVWSVWHAPLFLLSGTTQATSSPVWFTLGGLALAVLFAWVWNISGGNLLLLVLLHGALNGWYTAAVQGLAPEALGAGFELVTALAAAGLALVLVARVGRNLGVPTPRRAAGSVR
ncbi:MAG: CPBP family intramembrane metalloprotease [Nitriliruptor sp.]|nr:MAG: CPBP family intramembrane metalloprotease [Nitriliruptor sp.]